MTSPNYSQLELFSHDQEEEKLKPVKNAATPLTDYIRLYEKALLVAIGFVITAVVAFCFGVEKGKDAAASLKSSRFDVASGRTQEAGPPRAEIVLQPKPVRLNAEGKATIQGTFRDMPVKQEIILRPAQSARDSFTIQVASYQGRDTAEKEIARLRKNGFSPVVLKKGTFTVVCVGAFPTKETARSLLSQLRTKYRDCYIRRL